MLFRAYSAGHRAGGLAGRRALYGTLRGVLSTLLLGGSVAWGQAIGQVKSVQGTVMVMRATGTVPVTVGLLLEAGDVLTTQAHSTCGLTFRDASRFALGPQSILIVQQLTWDAQAQVGTSQTQVRQGTAVISSGGIAASGGKAMQVTTPRTTLAIGGTTLAVEVRR